MSRYQHGVRLARGVNLVQADRGPGLLASLLSTAAIAALALIPDAALAQSTWTGATSDYNTATNWTPNTVPASSGQSAIFAGTGNANVNVSAPVSPDSWTFNSLSQSYAITGSAVTLGTATGIQVNAANQLISIGNDLGGIGGLAINGTNNTVRLSGNNTYSGATTIASGMVLQANSATAFSANSAYTVNGDIDLVGFSNSIGSLSGSDASAFISNSGASAAVLTTVTSGTTIYAGRLQDDISTLGLTVGGTGTLVLTGNSNTYTGATTINSGATLQLGNNTANGNLQGTTHVTDNGTLAFNLNTTHIFSNNISGTGGVTDAGTGTIVLLPSASNTYSGPTVINSGATLQAGNAGAFATGGTLSDFTVNGTLDLNSFAVSANSLTGSGIVTNTGGADATLTVGTSGAPTFGGTLQDGSTNKLALTVTGTNTLTLTGTSTYSGATTINNGATLALSTTGSIASSAVTDNGTFDISGITGASTSIQAVTGSGAINLGTKQLTITNGAGVFSGTFSGTGALELSGGTTTFAGDVPNNVTVDSGATIQIGTGGTSGRVLGVLTNIGNSNVVIDRSDTVDLGTVITFIDSGHGTPTLVQAGTGTLTVSSVAVFQNVTISAGTLQVNNGALEVENNILNNGALVFNGGPRTEVVLYSSISGSGSLALTNGAQVSLLGASSYGGSTTINSGSALSIGDAFTHGSIGSGPIIDNGTLLIVRSDTVTYANAISGNGIFYQTGTGTLILTGANTFTGNVFIDTRGLSPNGTLQIGNGGTSGGLGTAGATVTDNGTLVFDRSDNISIANAISGTGNLTQAGSGTLTLTGATTYTGTTTINAGGTLALGASSSIATSGVVDNGTFDVSGVAAASISIKALSGSGAVNLGTKLMVITNGSGVFTGGVSGTGALEISGGTTTFATTIGNNVTIDSGATFQLGNGGTSGTVIANIANNGTLAIDRSDNVDLSTIANVQSSNGNLTQSGTGTLTVSHYIGTLNTITINAGTLVLTGASTPSYGNASVVDRGALVFDGTGSTSVQKTNGISDGGSVRVTGNGTAQLDGTNTYYGLTTIDSGSSLQIAGTFSGNGAIINNGNLFFQPATATTTTIANNISGSGAIFQTAPGTTVLTGTNTYTGGTTISSGTLQVGAGGTTGNITSGGIPDNGTLAFDRSDNIAIANIVSGTGGLTQMGAGTLTLMGANTYTGTTTVNAGGTLQIGAGGTTGSIAGGAITDNGTLAFDRSDTITYANVISGTGGLTQLGGGTLILDGANTYTGLTTVSNGILEIGDAANPGASVGGSVNVQSGATLYGHGTVKGNVAIASGGTLRPGGTIGTLTVNGNLSLPAGSTLVAELSPTAADRVTVGGAASLGGNLQLVADPGTYVAGTDFKLISASSVSGTFASVTGQVAGFVNTVQYSATGVDLILSNIPATTFLFGTYGTTANQTAAGNALTASSPTGALYTAMGALVGSSTASVPGALGQLAGDIRPSLRAAAIEDSRMIRDTLLDHMDQPGASMTVWGAGFAGYGSLSGNGNATSLHHDNAGFLAGIDMPVLPDVTLGADAGYSSNSAHTPGRISAASGDNGHVGAYASFHPGDLRFAIGGDYGFGSVTINRAVPSLGLTTTASQDQQTGQVFADLGYHIGLDGIALEPHAGIAHIAATGGAFAETGSVAALSGGEKSDSETYSMLGLRAGLAEMALDDDLTLTPRFDLGWQHALARLTPYQTVSYVSAGTSFTVLGTPLAQDAAALEAGFDLKLAPSASLFITYDGSFSSTVENHAFRGGLSWQF